MHIFCFAFALRLTDKFNKQTKETIKNKNFFIFNTHKKTQRVVLFEFIKVTDSSLNSEKIPEFFK
ncbi:hypothetical protein JCM31447_322000 [Fluviispira sanaruensis]|uniref:Uncharacterized protein n=1 Tax=Fluviispira sanaruensis TaxID=2493639 RepID=A0A4V0P2E1_FLUSA|nr:hypothetical protein JCM31447_322000 [Fluviispira sanaruensis]